MYMRYIYIYVSILTYTGSPSLTRPGTRNPRFKPITGHAPTFGRRRRSYICR